MSKRAHLLKISVIVNPLPKYLRFIGYLVMMEDLLDAMANVLALLDYRGLQRDTATGVR